MLRIVATDCHSMASKGNKNAVLITRDTYTADVLALTNPLGALMFAWLPLFSAGSPGLSFL
jgi:hypothetical protein